MPRLTRSQLPSLRLRWGGDRDRDEQPPRTSWQDGPLFLYGLAIALGRVYPRWVGLMAAISGRVHVQRCGGCGLRGVRATIVKLVGLLLLAVWAFVMAAPIGRNGSRRRVARSEADFLASGAATRQHALTVAVGGPEHLDSGPSSTCPYSPRARVEDAFSEVRALDSALALQ